MSEALRSSRAEVWDLKTITFGIGPEPKRSIKIITQNFNGFVALHSLEIYLIQSHPDHVRLSPSVGRMLLHVPKLNMDGIGNILILRGNIQVLPLERTTVSYEFLSQLVGEYLLTRSPDVDISAALSVMPLTQSWWDVCS
jgi:ubiquitin carboxyl-terminal hydrolase MINDY-1/2